MNKVKIALAFIVVLVAGCDTHIPGGELRRMVDDCDGLENINQINSSGTVARALCEDGSHSTGKPE